MRKMKQNWIVCWLGEVLRAALDAPPDDGNSDGSTRAQLAMLVDEENAAPAQMDEIMSRAEAIRGDHAPIGVRAQHGREMGEGPTHPRHTLGASESLVAHDVGVRTRARHAVKTA